MDTVFSGWARQVTFLVLYVTVIEMLLPMGELRRYVKLVLGLVVLLALIDPLLHLASGRDVEDMLRLPVGSLTASAEDPISTGIELSHTMAQETAATVESAIGAEIAQRIAALDGVKSANVMLTNGHASVTLVTDNGQATSGLVGQVKEIVASAAGVEVPSVDVNL